MTRPARIGGHTLEAKRIAEAVLRHHARFSNRHVRIAKSVEFNLARENFAALRDGVIAAALEEMSDALTEMGVPF